MKLSSKNNSGFVLIMSLILIILLGLLLAAASLRGNIELQESQNRLASQQAFYAAESGLQAAVEQLGLNASWNPQNPATPPSMANVPLQINNGNAHNTPLSAVGYYTEQVGPAPNFNFFQSVCVLSIGQSQILPGLTPPQGQLSRAILARVVVESPTQFFLSTAGNLNVVSGTSINSSVLGGNITFTVNPSLPSPQNEITIGGNVYFLQGVTGNTNPAVSITGVTTQSPTETFSGVDTSYYQNIAQNGGLNCANSGPYCDGSGNLTYNGTISKANLNAPNGVVYAPGNIYISGTVSDSMVFVAGGNVYIQDDVTVPNGPNGTLPQNNSNAPQLGLLAEGDVIIPDSAPSNLTIDAFLMANGGPGSQGGILQAQGPNYSKGTLNILGSVALRGSNDTTAQSTAADLNVYANRNYQYNTQFQSNLQIPFLPAISQIVNWQEVSPNDPLPGTC